MEKRRAHYDLSLVVVEVRARGVRSFTKTALDGGRAMGLTSAEMIEIVCGLQSADLYKSMTTYADSTIWQDVYHADTAVGKAYIKVTLFTDCAPVIQFKGLYS